MMLPNSRQLRSHRLIFLRRPADISSVTQTGYPSQEVGPSPSMIVLIKRGFFMLNHDGFQTPTKWILCLNNPVLTYWLFAGMHFTFHLFISLEAELVLLLLNSK